MKNGLSPSSISKKMDISVGSVIQYLSTKVGEGDIALVDIYYSWSEEQREFLQRSDEFDTSGLRDKGITKEELKLFHSLRKAHVFRGGMYEIVSELEIDIHDLVRSRLIKEFGAGDYWREGVPVTVRKSCAVSQQEDDNPVEDIFAYTTLIHLWEIIDKKWGIFESIIPSNYSNKKQELKKDMKKLNSIRNRVMHPVKNNKWKEDDFIFVRRLALVFMGIQRSKGVLETIK